MKWLKRHWIATTISMALFVLGVIIGAGAKVETTLTETLKQFETVISLDTVTTTRTKVVSRQPPSRGVKVSYGDFPGLFTISGAHVINDGGNHATVLGQFTYLGGGDCKPLSYVEVSGTFFGDGGGVVGTGLWISDTAPADVGLPMEVSGSARRGVRRAEIVVTGASCS